MAYPISGGDRISTPMPNLCKHTLRQRECAGYTLIELLVVLGIVALLLTLAVPRFFPSVDAAHKTILATTCTTRAVIDEFYADVGRYPESLDVLVEKRYLPSLPSIRSLT
jgi:general secretion pathway protein G